MLALDHVGKTYPNGVHALENFSARIKPGEIVAIIGGSGCGKSTLLRAISGLDRATTGSVTLDAISITAPHEKIGIIFQEPRLLPWLSVAENIGFGLGHLTFGERQQRIARALARVGLADKANAWPREFLLEATLLACLGSLVGMTLALVGGLVLAPILAIPFVFDPLINVAALLFSALIGIVFGYFPARRAARLNPIEALRHE